jgi:hypothetical protein
VSDYDLSVFSTEGDASKASMVWQKARQDKQAPVTIIGGMPRCKFNDRILYFAMMGIVHGA